MYARRKGSLYGAFRQKREMDWGEYGKRLLQALTRKNFFKPLLRLFLWKKMKEDKDFFEAVYDIVRLIPHGKVTTYGAIAQALGSKGAARMVGWAMNASHMAANIPAHRVVNRNGLLTGKMHFPTPTTMEKRIMEEGIMVENDQILNFKSVFWDPSTEIMVD